VNTDARLPVAALRRIGIGRTPAFQAFARARNSLTRRQWLVAAGVGVLMGVYDAAFNFLYAIRSLVASYPKVLAVGPRFFVILLTHWVPLMVGVACGLALALALLRDLSRRGALRPRDMALTIFAVAAFGSLIVDPIAVAALSAVASWIRWPVPGFLAGADWLTALPRMYAISGEKVLTFVATVILSGVYYLKDLRTSDALAATQLGLSQAQRRRLTEELRTAQAALDPDFLFATLAEVDRRFEGDPLVAQRLLDALIRYLRAALPAKDDHIGTLGQQATLVRTYLEIESIRSSGHLQADVDVPIELDSRLFAPSLLLPLVALVAGDVAKTGRDARVHVGATSADGKLAVEVRSDGCQPWATAEQETTLASLRDRARALYGSSAELSFAIRAPRGSTARIVVDDPGTL
jgi:hypothetical protein